MRDEFELKVGTRARGPGRAKIGVFYTFVVYTVLFFGFLRPVCLAVSSKVTRHSSAADLLKGEVKDVVVSSQGTVQLGRAAEVLVDDFADVWSVNSIVVSGGTVFVGTSPNGGIFKYSLGKLTKIYPLESKEPEKGNGGEGDSASGTDDPNVVKTEEYLSNEHIFVMATDMAGRLLAGISGDECKLLRFEADKTETIFEPNEAKYIFAIALDDKGNIYLGTGPQGQIYRIDPFGGSGRRESGTHKAAHLVYDSLDKNILSLTIGPDGFIYAGSDSRGLIYKIDPGSKRATVLYDSDQPEITALMMGEDGDLYATATSAKVAQAQTEFASQVPLAGRPEAKPESKKGPSESEGGLELKIPNTKKEADGKQGKKKAPPREGAKPSEASHIYKITEDGYVTDVFSEAAVFFTLAAQDGTLLVGTGNSAQLFTVEPALEQETVIYEDQQASQITAVAVCGDDVYLGTANPAKLVRLSRAFASEGTYTSDLIDAGQPARWGKLQIEADIPPGCRVMVTSRSGNVKDVNDPTFSDWSEPTEITGPAQLRCPLGRFCQYKLVMQSENGMKSPVIREIAVANTVPNLAPKVESVSVRRVGAKDKLGVFKVTYKARDDNQDKLIYKIDFRKLGRNNWIELKDKVEADSFEWDGKTVEDGRYEVRVTASDERSNTSTTKLAGSRVSEPAIVDNTGPVIKSYSVDSDEKAIMLKLEVVDELSTIGDVRYTIDSNADWTGAMPDDLVYDTTNEDFTIVIEDLKAGDHVVALKVTDDVGNTTYKTFDVVRGE